jgi:hypothetical protein
MKDVNLVRENSLDVLLGLATSADFHRTIINIKFQTIKYVK